MYSGQLMWDCQLSKLTAKAEYIESTELALIKSVEGYKTSKSRTINERVGQLGEAIGIKGSSPRDCRHYFATDAIRNGTDIKSLRDSGGWNSPHMPLRYAESAKIANSGVKLSAHKKAH